VLFEVVPAECAGGKECKEPAAIEEWVILHMLAERPSRSASMQHL
jgi:hypothetical protein